MRSGAARIGLGGTAEDQKLLDAGASAVNRKAARSYSLRWDARGEPVLEVDWIGGNYEEYQLSKTMLGEKILSSRGSEFPAQWLPNVPSVPWSPSQWSQPSSWPEGLGTGNSSFQPEVKKSFLDQGNSGGKSEGSGSPGGKEGLLTWAPRGWPADVSDYLKWAFIIAAIGVGVVVLDFVTKD